MARPIQALASLAALVSGHFAAFLSLTPAPPRGSHISLGQHYRQEQDKEKHNNYQDHRL
jgi:hypothetical protein